MFIRSDIHVLPLFGVEPSVYQQRDVLVAHESGHDYPPDPVVTISHTGLGQSFVFTLPASHVHSLFKPMLQYVKQFSGVLWAISGQFGTIWGCAHTQILQGF